MSKRAAQKVATRERLLDVAREQFNQHGYDEVTFRGLAKLAGVSTGAFFGSYDTKRDLYFAAMGIPAPDVEDFLSRLAADAKGGDPSEIATLFASYGQEAELLRSQLTGSAG